MMKTDSLKKKKMSLIIILKILVSIFLISLLKKKKTRTTTASLENLRIKKTCRSKMIYTCEHQIQGKRGTTYYILVRNVIRAYFNSSKGPGSTCLKWPSEYQLSKTPFWAYNTLQYFILYRSSCFVLKKLIIRSSRFPSNFGFLSSFVGLT